MNIARIAALLEPFLERSLDPFQLDQISTYIDLLKRWNARINLTAIRKEEEIVTRHFGESFFMARHLFPKGLEDASSMKDGLSVARAPSPAKAGSAQLPAIPQSPIPCHPEQSEGPHAPKTRHPERSRKNHSSGSQPHVLDIGSGAGFPALPLKIWAPQIHLTLIESNHKKATFLREVSRTLILTDINVITDRAEVAAKSPDIPGAEVVTLRAVEHFETILPQAVAFLVPNATLALLIGATQLPHLNALTTLNWNPPIPIPQSQSRVLAIGRNNEVDIN
ncbi:MAG: 16S rRNA (guanine(527)-N(7))-methyltransferase RsmG [Terriglobales bacterium]